jgi:hypothetical protein
MPSQSSYVQLCHHPDLAFMARRCLVLRVHVSHAAGRSALLFFRNVGDEGFGGQHQRRDRAGVLQCGAHQLGRVEHACLDQVFVLAGQGVIAEVVVLRVVNLAQDYSAFLAGVLGDLAQRRILFLTEIALWKYRANFPVLICQPALVTQQRQFDEDFALTMADRLEGRSSKPSKIQWHTARGMLRLMRKHRNRRSPIEILHCSPCAVEFRT